MRSVSAQFVSVLLCALAMVGCGSRSDTPRTLDAGPSEPILPERCNGLDDDRVSGVDDPFRDAFGRYIADAHCGACNEVCAPRTTAELEAHCRLVGEVPRCVATRCASGTAPTDDGRCAEVAERLCLPCANDFDCGALSGAACATIAGEARCSIDCALGCPSGYRCDEERGWCTPSGGSCSCTPGQSFDLACAVASAKREQGAPVCVGRARCEQGVLSACQTEVEVCDLDDNDCDGNIDEGFVDVRGAYTLDPANCGKCGVSCLEDTGLELELACGGDPFAPSCTLACPDARDGVQVGDLLDGDLDVATGCECRVSSLRDEPGPLGASGELLDVNCDGADGEVVSSFYVAVDGNDTWPGSPTRPLRTIAVAVQQARASLTKGPARPDVFVAAGTYTETLELADGVRIHGGYRRDFRALDPAAFVVEVRAPAGTSTPGGAVLVARDVGGQATLIEGMTLRGLDAPAPEAATVGAYLERPGPNLSLRRLTIRAGVPGEGRTGADGAAGSPPSTFAGTGAAPRAAVEQERSHNCLPSAQNVGSGGAGGQNVCGGSDVRGGTGGEADCPISASFQGSGERGRAPSGAGGVGGSGGQDSEGPLRLSAGCPSDVCCGLADFTVPSDFSGPRAGDNGRDGSTGVAGVGCREAHGSFQGGVWHGGRGTPGAAGEPGAGGGGGGAGGGVEMEFIAGLCEFADGLGGGGGGGGAGGCGGGAGAEGTSGAPSIALLLVDPGAFALEGVSLEPASGGRGGPGGAGGDGGPGGIGAAGGAVPPELRTTPTLAGPFPGARGGSGGTGGPGGGGGGGCGGASVGVWIVGAEPPNRASWQAQNAFVAGSGGEGGAGGSGAQTGSGGSRGEALDVFVQP